MNFVPRQLLLVMAILASLFLQSFAQEVPADTADDTEDITFQDTSTTNDADEEEDDDQEIDLTNRIIHDIIITGNTQVSTEAIRNKIPYRIGQRFDPIKTRELIDNLYYDFKRFRNITIMADPLDDDLVDLHIIIQEKIPVKEIIFEGNSAVTQKEILEKVTSLDTPAIDQEELKIFAQAIKKLYLERGYYQATIDTELTVDDNGKATITFKITEGRKSLVKCISFKGNKQVSGKTLRSIMYTREDWLLSFLDKSGTYIPERLEGDKHVIEMYYQSHGYMNAKVAAITPEIDPCSHNVNLLIEIHEGDLYTVGSVSAPGNDLICEDVLLKAIPIKPGDLYSREKIVDTIKNLELLWGNFGYLYAHIEPSIEVHEDTKTVDLGFHTELGKQIVLGKLTIRGNQKTRDKIIRRQITFAEGDTLTNTRMEQSKERIQSLGYFDQREGVNWKIIRTGENTADLDLMLKEAKTGHMEFQLGFAGNPENIRSPLKGMSLQLNVGDTNLFGTGIRTSLNSRFSHEDFTLNFNITQPWLFDKPIIAALDVFHRRLAYEDFNYTVPVNEIDSGMTLTGGVIASYLNPCLPDALIRGVLGIDSIKYQPEPKATIQLTNPEEQEIANANYNIILNRMFKPGKYGSFTIFAGQDKRSHPVHPISGYSWLARAQVTFDATDRCLGFQRYDLEAHWYTPLIGNYDLIFHIHGYIGAVVPFAHKLIPYRDLYHIGGPASVRGFLFGEIGPQFKVRNMITDTSARGDSIGGTKAMYLNTELIFPITPDMNMKGVIFYDGGSGWDNPYVDCVERRFIQNNHFNYRHAVGFGIRMYSPMPLKIDWGFKLDPRKGEPAYEVHFNTNYEW
jgi:outer membrane protein insertion porin family